mgnify:CR=1 FL=1
MIEQMMTTAQLILVISIQTGQIEINKSRLWLHCMEKMKETVGNRLKFNSN